MKPVRKKFRVPIFCVDVRVVVADNIRSERARLSKIFGPAPLNTYIGCCAYNQNHFAIFLEAPAALDRAIVAHEIYHLTHRILEYRNTRLADETCEVCALLHEYLTESVSRILDLNLKSSTK